MADPHELVCIYKATNPSKAELVRNLLEAEGIRAATADTHNPFPGLSIMPSEVFVERSNEQTARSIITEAEQNPSNDSDDFDETSEAALEEAPEP